ncbi:MAG: hypothetical protein JXR83_03970 [Deltaproteobacteria bacterium]|nr:hypothetical protein [Deltaproteobacteria bacterium]
MGRQIVCWSCAVLIALGMLGCPRDFRAISIDPAGNESRPLTRIGETQRFTAGGIDADGFRVLIENANWQSSDEKVFAVDERGIVTARGSGRAELRASFEQFADMVPIVIKIIHRIKLDPEDPQLVRVGHGLKFTAKVFNERGEELRDYQVKWSKQGDAIANDDGLVLGMHSGDGLLIARVGAAQASVKITVVGSGVSPIPATGL